MIFRCSGAWSSTRSVRTIAPNGIFARLAGYDTLALVTSSFGFAICTNMSSLTGFLVSR